MNASTSTTKDPICGMTVDPKNSLHVERDGAHFYFCSDQCRDKFVSAPVGTKPQGKPGSCCG